jgi:hypothetical protein
MWCKLKQILRISLYKSHAKTVLFVDRCSTNLLSGSLLLGVFSHCSLSSKQLIKPNASSRLQRICVSQLIHLSVNMSSSPLISPRLKHEQPMKSGVNVVRPPSAGIENYIRRSCRKVFRCHMHLFLTSHNSQVTSFNINKRTSICHTVLPSMLSNILCSIISCLHHHNLKSNHRIQSSQSRRISPHHSCSNFSNLFIR